MASPYLRTEGPTASRRQVLLTRAVVLASHQLVTAWNQNGAK